MNRDDGVDGIKRRLWISVTMLAILLGPVVLATLFWRPMAGMAGWSNPNDSPFRVVAPILLTIEAITFGAAVVWFCWIQPVWMAADPATLKGRLPPRSITRALRGLIWTPTLVCGGLLATAVLTRTPLQEDIGLDRITLVEIFAIGVMATVTAGVASLLHRTIARRVPRTAFAASLCESCGYDRRYTSPSDACPECGQVPTIQHHPPGRTPADAIAGDTSAGDAPSPPSADPPVGAASP